MEGAEASTAQPSRRQRLPALDAVRVLTVMSVIVVHGLSVVVPEDAGAAGAVVTVFHSSREVFLLLSALVLTYTSRGAVPAAGRFWRRRMPLILAPYAAWTVIYLLADGHLTSPETVTGRLAVDLVSSGARYHLYFVLLTFQLYLVFPWLLRWVRARNGRLLRVAAGSVVVQLAFTAVVHYQLRVPPPLSWLAAHPGSWLPAYQLYVVAGVAVGLHIDEVTMWCARHVVVLAVAAGAVIAASVAWYEASLHLLAYAPVHASEVFQPAVVVESLALGAVELGACQRYVARASARPLAWLARGSDVSFGVYLLHPLLLQGAMAAGLGTALATLPSGAAVALVAVIGPPVVLAGAGTLVAALRATPVSLWLCGRPRRVRRAPSRAVLAATLPLPNRAGLSPEVQAGAS